MRIVYVGDLNEGGRCHQRYRWLSRLGHDVVGVPSYPLDGRQFRAFSLVDRLLFRLGYPRDTMGINALIPRLCAEHEAELLWVDKGEALWPATIPAARRARPGLRALYFSEDDVFLPHNRTVFLTYALREYDVVFTTKPRNLGELPLLGARRVHCVFQGYDPTVHRRLELSAEERARFGADVAFVGTFEAERGASVARLAAAGVNVTVYGSYWDRFAKGHPRLRVVPGHLGADDFVRVLNASRINLNFLRRQNRDRHTSRSLEIPACGAFMLAERSDEHAQLFEEGVEAEFFGDDDELVAKCVRYLADEPARAAVAARGYARCLRSGYAHEDRLAQVLALAFDEPRARSAEQVASC